MAPLLMQVRGEIKEEANARSALSVRVDAVEATIDRMRGALAVPAALLIVTNLILAMATLAMMVRG